MGRDPIFMKECKAYGGSFFATQRPVKSRRARFVRQRTVKLQRARCARHHTCVVLEKQSPTTNTTSPPSIFDGGDVVLVVNLFQDS